MSTVAVPPSQPRTAISPRAVIVQEKVSIPGWIGDLASYRQWAHTDAYPQTGWVSYLNGEIWVDMEMEGLITHNRVKVAYTGTLFAVVQQHPIGDLIAD